MPRLFQPTIGSYTLRCTAVYDRLQLAMQYNIRLLRLDRMQAIQ